jgi:hypothetical protein
MSPTETILQQLLNTLQTEFETILRAYPTTYDNCPGVQAWHFGLPDLRRASQMPLVAIDLDRQSLQTRTLGGFGTGKRERLIPAQIIIAHAHRDEEQLTRQLLQLTDALAQALEAITPKALTGSSKKSNSPTTPRPSKPKPTHPSSASPPCDSPSATATHAACHNM